MSAKDVLLKFFSAFCCVFCKMERLLVIPSHHLFITNTQSIQSREMLGTSAITPIEPRIAIGAATMRSATHRPSCTRQRQQLCPPPQSNEYLPELIAPIPCWPVRMRALPRPGFPTSEAPHPHNDRQNGRNFLGESPHPEVCTSQ